jgi:hypothetical protein
MPDSRKICMCDDTTTTSSSSSLSLIDFILRSFKKRFMHSKKPMPRLPQQPPRRALYLHQPKTRHVCLLRVPRRPRSRCCNMILTHKCKSLNARNEKLCGNKKPWKPLNALRNPLRRMPYVVYRRDVFIDIDINVSICSTKQNCCESATWTKKPLSRHKRNSSRKLPQRTFNESFVVY